MFTRLLFAIPVLFLLSLGHVPGQRSFTKRPSTFVGRGEVTIIGNRVLVGSNSNRDNQSTTLSHIDQDSESATSLNSSNATLTLPSGSTVYWAGLYWGGRSTSNDRNKMKFRIAGQSYATVTATTLDDGNTISSAAGENHYQCFYDVTSYVQTYGSGIYWGGDVQTTAGNGANDPNGTGYYGGWAMIVVYANDIHPYRSINVYDGYNVCWNNSITVPINGFLTPDAGSFETKVGVVAWEGDLYISGDKLRMNQNTDNTYNVLNGANPGTNFYNGTITTTPRNPQTSHNWGVDFDYIVSNLSPPNGSTSTNMFFNSSGDFYLPGVLIFTTEINPVLLPVQLSQFSANCKDHSVQLAWTTQTEVNNNKFEIYKSTDFKNFHLAGIVSGSGTSSMPRQYSWNDPSFTNGKVAYRLLQIDFNNKGQPYGPVMAECKSTDLSVSVFPNPVISKIIIELNDPPEKVDYKLFTDDLRECYSGKFTLSGDNRIEIDLSGLSLPEGVLYLQIITDDRVINRKLVCLKK